MIRGVLAFSLQSGSNGNAFYVEAGGVRLLFDAGISGKRAEERLAQHGRDIRSVDAVIISHDHRDHIACAGIYQRKYGLPIYMTRRTHDAASRSLNLGKLFDVRYFESGETLAIQAVKVHTVPTPHDAADGVAFVVEFEGKRLGILSDLGHLFPQLEGILASVDGAFLESNYDVERLAHGPYPQHIKRRIRGPGGHLSNDESASLVASCGRNRPQWIAVAHLSGENNCPELAIKTHQRAVGTDYPVFCAPRDGCSELLHV